jgi:hypothetical protein
MAESIQLRRLGSRTKTVIAFSRESTGFLTKVLSVLYGVLGHRKGSSYQPLYFGLCSTAIISYEAMLGNAFQQFL